MVDVVVVGWIRVSPRDDDDDDKSGQRNEDMPGPDQYGMDDSRELAASGTGLSVHDV